MPKDEKAKLNIEQAEADYEKESEPNEGAGLFANLPESIRKMPLKLWLWLVLLLLILISALLFAFDSSFRVQTVSITGNHHVKLEEIEACAEIYEGAHLASNLGGSVSKFFTLHYGEIEEKLENQFPYIAKANVYVRYPGQVYIEVTERKKVAYVAIPDGYAIIAEDGVVLEICQGDVPKGIPEIRGLPIRSAQVGKSLDLTSQEGYDVCITILGAVLGADATVEEGEDAFDFLSHVICIRYCENMTTFIDLSVPGVLQTITVEIGSITTISDDMNWLRYAITSGYFDNKTGTLLDMTGSKYILR